MIEIWKDVEGYEGLYKISSKGRVVSYAKVNGKSPRPEKEIAQIISWGYKKVGLSRNKVNKLCFVHRLSALTFLENPENKSQVNHIDGNKLNNNLENLEWATPSENVIHAHRTGLVKKRMSSDNCNSVKVKYLDIETGHEMIFMSIKELNNNLKSSHSSIARILNGVAKTKLYKKRYKLEYA